MAHGPALDRLARLGVEADLDGAGLRGVAREVALVLQGRQVRVDRGAGREADGFADLPDARRVAAVADLGVDELEHLALTGGQIGRWRGRYHDRAFGANTCSQFLPETLDPNGCSCRRYEQCSVGLRVAVADGSEQTPRISVTPPWSCSSAGRRHGAKTVQRKEQAMAAIMIPTGSSRLDERTIPITTRPSARRQPTTAPGRRPSVATGRARGAVGSATSVRHVERRLARPATGRRPSQPVGPVTRATYWRRRAFVAALVVGLVLVMAQAGAALGGSPLATPERRTTSASSSRSAHDRPPR